MRNAEVHRQRVGALRVLAAGELRGLDDLGALVEGRRVLEGARRQPGAGRAGCATLRLAGCPPLLVKRYLRGGALARVNPDRYASCARFERELRVGQAARSAGLPVGEMLAVVVESARPGVRAWGFARLVEGAKNLHAWFRELAGDDALTMWRAAARTLAAMRDAGLWHPDLNLGNLVAAVPEPGHEPLVHVVDLDKARWNPDGLSAGAAQRMAARLERSWTKLLGDGPVDRATRERVAEDQLTRRA